MQVASMHTAYRILLALCSHVVDAHRIVPEEGAVYK